MSAPAEARTWVTEIGYAAADTGPLQALHSHMPEAEPVPEAEPLPEPECEAEI